MQRSQCFLQAKAVLVIFSVPFLMLLLPPPCHLCDACVFGYIYEYSFHIFMELSQRYEELFSFMTINRSYDGEDIFLAKTAGPSERLLSHSPLRQHACGEDEGRCRAWSVCHQSDLVLSTDFLAPCLPRAGGHLANHAVSPTQTLPDTLFSTF